MHSSNLRGTDFSIFHQKQEVSHATFFSGFSNMERLGIVAPKGIDGVGAVALIMAYVTAFYDTYREAGGDFFAYPNYYTFQSASSLASYTMLDIWPKHKDVFVEDDPINRLNAINDRAISILLLPDGKPTHPDLERPQVETALRTIKRCYLYLGCGQVKNADLTVETHSSEIVDWAKTIFDTHDYLPNPAFAEQKASWLAKHGDKRSLKQSYRQITVNEALARL